MAGYTDYSRAGMHRCIVEARRAVDITPDYALGYSVLAQSEANLLLFAGGRDEALAREVRTLASHALTLSPNDPRVLTGVAAALNRSGSQREALVYAQRAVELNPNHAHAHAILAELCIYFNRPEDALVNLDAADSLAPRGFMTMFNGIRRAWAHFQAGRHELALQVMQQSRLLHPGFTLALKDEAVFCEQLGHHQEARDAVRRLRATDKSLTLAGLQAFNAQCWLAPELAEEANALLAKAWIDTPLESEDT